jgi:N-acetylmuramoyl-L-alanine amidase
MALRKQDLNHILTGEAIQNSDEKNNFQQKTLASIDETYAKRTTLVGQIDGQILGGIKALGASTNSSEEVITSAVGAITDAFPTTGAVGNLIVATKDTVVDSNGEFLRFKSDLDSAGGLVLNTLGIDSDGSGNLSVLRGAGRDSADEARGFGTLETTVTALTGLPAIKVSNPTSALAVITDGTAESIAQCVAIADDKKAEAYASLIEFTTAVDAAKPKSVGGGGIMGFIATVTSAISVAGNLANTLGAISPVAAINDAIQTAQDAVNNTTFVKELNATVQGIKDSLPTLADVEAVIGTDLKDIKSAINEATDAIDTFNAEFDARVESGLPGVLQDVAENLSGTASEFIANLVPGGIVSSDAERQQILSQFTSGDPRQKKEAVKTLVRKSDNVTGRMKEIIASDEGTSSSLEMQIQMIEKAKAQGVPEQEIARAQQEISTIDDKMSKLDTTISGTVVIDASLYEEGQPVSTDKWDGRNSPDDTFTYVSSVEELDAEFTRVERDVTEVVVHASETHTNKDIGSIEINNIQIDLGHDGIGYHYVIRRDGRLQRGRPVNIQGDHAPVNGHDKFSIGIVMVGGINVATGEDNPTDYLSSQSFTREQFTTLEKFLNGYYRRFPGGQVFGHNDIDVNELDPYFDVVDYVESVFRKQNRTDDPLNASPLSPSEMNSDN